MKKHWVNIVLLLLTFIIFFIVVMFTDGFDKFISNLSNINPIWFLIALGAMIIYWLLEAIILHMFIKLKYNKYKFSSTFRVSMIGQFFNAVTPSASGGQPMQLYALTKDGIGSGEAGSVLVMKFIVYQAVLTIYSLVIIIFKYSFFTEKVDKFMLLALFGFTINTAVIALLLAFTKYPKVSKGFIHWIFKVCAKLKILKETEETESRIEEELEYFKTHSADLRENSKILIQTVILTVIQLTVFFAIAYFLYKGFESKSGLDNFINILSANAFVTMVSSMVPLPGASGGAEGSFYMIFQSFLSAGKILPTLFLWRFITFYLNLIVGGIYTLIPSTNEPIKTQRKIVYKERSIISED